MAEALTFELLRDAVATGKAAIRARTRLQPAGGPGDKLFPPTFGDTLVVRLSDGERKTKYALEERRIDGQNRWCVLLDSVASQANRMEEALQRAWDEGRVEFPLVRVDFRGETHEEPALDLSSLGGDGFLTALEAPHRLADALLRDSMLGNLRFRASKPGRELTEATPQNATGIYALCPPALVFGMWDSTGPRGGQGSKFQRALVSEIVGVGVALGRKTSSRIDPAGIELNAGPVYEATDKEEEWTLDASSARQEKGGPVRFSRKGRDQAGRPSTINHGNIAPSIDSEAGGVTVDYAVQTTVLSLPALRRLRFPRQADGSPVPDERRKEAEDSARTALAALGLAAIAFQRDDGYDLRSRCALVPEGPLALEIVDRDGTTLGPYSLTAEEAAAVLHEAAKAARQLGMGWSGDPVTLRPAPKLVQLIRKSREVAASDDGKSHE